MNKLCCNQYFRIFALFYGPYLKVILFFRLERADEVVEMPQAKVRPFQSSPEPTYRHYDFAFFKIYFPLSIFWAAIEIYKDPPKNLRLDYFPTVHPFHFTFT